jgi:asparagine synthase (glutamine-hydrolysing)
MLPALTHRGPDDAGVWVDETLGLALGHRRLSIVDLSPAGHQPMYSASGRYVMAFNGEIYNHESIRADLEAAGARPAWRGHSDTETLLAAIEHWGVEATLRLAVGMFAIALWDRERRRLTLARDRAGEKPLYYGLQGETLLFASELKPLRRHPAFRGEVDRGALALYLRHNYVPDPLSIYVGISKLDPGTWVEFAERGRETARAAYWNAVEVVDRGRARPFAGSDGEAVAALEQVLGQAVGAQMVADVPLGAFLSGGIDSTTIVALMQERASRPVRTFTIGFTDPAFDESPSARAVAAHLGTDHTELKVTPEDAMGVIPRLPEIYDEPFADSSQIPTFLVSQLARRHVTVSLSGDAGDELFGGYNRYFWAQRVWSNLQRVPRPLRRLGSNLITARSAEAWDGSFGLLNRVLPARLRTTRSGNKLHRLAGLLGAESPAAIYRSLVSHWENPRELLQSGSEPPSRLEALMAADDPGTFPERMMLWDLLTYLPGDILAKVDRAAMAVSLETRVPMLDHRVIEFAWTLPQHLRIRDGQGKWLLRQVLYKRVPREIMDRPKMGFGVPINAWLRGPLRDWAADLLDERRMREDGFLDPAPVHAKWREHLAGERDWAYWLWDVLMFQAWRRHP